MPIMMAGAGRCAEQNHQPSPVTIKTNDVSRISCSAVNSVRQHENSNNFENCALLGKRVKEVGSD